jgi:anti-sigma regulatory factor (Ser/Thr protein kinase)
MARIALELQANEDAPARAREAVRGVAPGMLEEDRWRAELIVTELVTNAVIHGPGSPVELALESGGAGVRGQVADPGPGIARRREERPARPHGGRGLIIVDHLADGWGLAPDRSRVWFEILGTA